MRKYLITCFFVAATLLINPVSALGDLGGRAIFDDINNMTSEEIVAEMKYVAAMSKDGKYYPQDRIHALEQQLAVNQTAEIERFKDQLKKDAAIAKQVEDLKAKAIAKAQEKGNELYGKHEDEIKAYVEDQARKQLKMSTTDWQAMKDDFNKMYKDGSDAYDKHLAGYVEMAQKAYEAYNAYTKAKSDHPEAPEAAQNLVGFLNATGAVLNFAGEKMDKTPLRPIGEILKLYGAATGLGNTAATTAWNYVHGDGINPYFETQYSEGFKKAGLDITDHMFIEKSNLMLFDKNIRILKLPNGEYVVFNDKFEIVPGSRGNILSADEYEKLEQLYVSYSNGKEEGWSNLTTEQLAQLVRGEKIKVTVDDNWWPRSDEIKEFTLESLLAMGESHANRTMSNDFFTSIDRILNGDQSLFGEIGDRIFGSDRDRRNEIWELFSQYLENNPSYDSLIHDREAFLEWIKEIKAANDDLSPEELKDLIKVILALGTKDENRGNEDENTNQEGEYENKNPLIEGLEGIDPEVTGANASGINTGESTSNTGDHWTQKTPEDFNGTKDGGFTNTGGTNRPMPGGGNPQGIGIPVLKPNIYLYPEKEQSVQLTFRYPQQLTRVIPDYVNYWKVIATPAGFLDDTYDFLFYEALVQEVFFQKDFGWKLPVNDRETSLEEILDLYRFNEQEKYDFMEFWLSKLDPTIEYLVYPQETEIIDWVMPVDVTPEPARSYRLWFHFIPADGSDIVEPDTVEVIIRERFTLVEWGGMYK
jgi:predicted nucleic acid-binding protein